MQCSEPFYYLPIVAGNFIHQCICAVAVVHLITKGLNVRARFKITVQISRHLCSPAQENVSVKHLFVLATKLAVTRIDRLTSTVQVRDCLGLIKT